MIPIPTGSTRPPAHIPATSGMQPPPAPASFSARVSAFQAGVTEIGALPYAVVCMYLGPSIEVICTRGGTQRHGREVAGDLDIIPPHTPCSWETKQGGTTLVIRVPDELLRAVAVELDMDPSNIAITDRFQLRDPMLEHIAWALKADIDSGGAGGKLFRDSLGNAFAARLLQRHGRRSLPMRDAKGGLSTWKLKQVISHIEDNLESELPLTEIAQIAGVSVSHLKTLFRRSTGAPVHQYILRRRVERAKILLRDRNLSIAQVAFATGFAHQSHLARHMRKILGVTPAAARKELAS